MGRGKSYRKFTIKMQKKLVVLFIAVLLAFAGLFYQLYRISRDNGEQYKKQVLSQQRYDSTTIPYKRGTILDANGSVLATSEKVYNVILDSVAISEKEEYLEPTLSALQREFGIDTASIRDYIEKNKETSRYHVLAKRLSYSEISDFLDMQNEEGSQIKGIWFDEEYKRVYPGNSLACDVIGFTTADNRGNYGLEEYYNDVLSGIPGREYGYLNDDSDLERKTIAAEDGNSLVTTIDANIQSIVEKYLLKFNEEYKDKFHPGNGAENVGCIIMKVDSGEILAMANYPNFDLNDTRNTDALMGMPLLDEKGNKTGEYLTEENMDVLDDEEMLYQHLDALWKNYCISSTYEPGSVAKPFTVAAGVESGKITGTETYNCEGSLEIGGWPIRCHNRYGDGLLTVQEGIERSCNVVMMKIGQAMGTDTFVKFQHIFNFGLKTNIDLQGEARTASLIYTKDTMGSTEMATNTFGQSFNVTMIQMITGFCSLINGGYYYEPHMVDKITNASGATVENIEPRVLRQTISESTSAKIRQYCRATVMEEGGDRRTGRTARPAGYAIGGKTGTAETIPRKNGEYVVSFMGYAPADDPQIAIYVVVDRANASPQDDAKFATGIVRNVLTEVLPYLNIFMTEELSEKEIQELAEKQIEITNQYTQKPEDGEDQNNGDGTGDGQTGDDQTGSGDGTGDGQGGDDSTPSEDWRNYPVDPATGYLVSPIDGGLIDPVTGADVGGDDSLGDSPVNNNLLNQQNE